MSGDEVFVTLVSGVLGSAPARAIALMGLRRNNAGGFGSLVPEQTRSTGFYG